jgi:hypothetical protein
VATKKSTKATRARKSRSRSHNVRIGLAALTLGTFAVVAVELALGRRRIRDLRDVPPLDDAEAPMVSILVAALNEETTVAAAMQSLLSLDYPNYEVVAVNDRSTDRTGEILDALVWRGLESASTDSTGEAERGLKSAPHEGAKLRVVHINDLPEGWLGKNHALQTAADAARGELLLFTDADIHFERSALARAVRYMREHEIDHLAAIPRIAAPGIWIKLAVHFFSFAFAVFMKPWKAGDPKSSRHIGVGAFNLVRADVYRRAGGHTRIRMRPDDDIKLGKIVKQSGGKQELINAAGMLEVTWYPTVREFVRGLEKNTFSSLEYNAPLTLLVCAAAVGFHIWPSAALFVTRGLERKLWSGVAAIQMLLLGAIARDAGDTPLLGIGYPVAAAIFTYTITAATLKTLVRGGIEWRGTHYSLEALRANRV